jgi:hypothetical protein
MNRMPVHAVFPVRIRASSVFFLRPFICDRKRPVITIAIPVIFCNDILSPMRINEKIAVKTGMQLENTFAFEIPIFPTE